MWADFIQSRPSSLTEQTRGGIRRWESLLVPVSSQSVSVARGPDGVLCGWSSLTVGTVSGPQGHPGLGEAVLNLQIQALGKFFYVWKGLEIKRAGFQLQECWPFPLGIIFCVNFLKTFKSFCQQGQRQTDPGDEVAERAVQSRGQSHS